MESKHFSLYPIYLDSTRSLSEGRRFRKELCIQKPRYHEIKGALGRLGIEHVEEPSKKHPQDFFNSGRFSIKKEYGKLFVIEGIVQAVAEMRKGKTTESTPSEKQAHGKAVAGVVQNGVYVENKLNLVRKKKAKKKK